MKLTINKEFLKRHLFAALVFAGMGVWFGYDGFVRYPNTPAPALYESIEGAKPPEKMTMAKLEAFKAQKTAAQRGLCLALLAVAAIVGLQLWTVSRLDFAFDDDGFTWKSKRYGYGDIKSIDRSRWEKKGVIKLTLADGAVTLDAWHHAGVSEFVREKLPQA